MTIVNSHVSQCGGGDEPLSAIVEEIDPLYRPARFLLGFTYLRSGDGQRAAVQFEKLVKEFEDEIPLLVDKLAADFLSGVRFPKVARRIHFVRQWGGIYREALSGLHGGEYVRVAETWEQLKSQLDEQVDDWLRELHTITINRLVETLHTTLKSDLPAIAAGKLKSEEWSAEAARAQLDFFFGNKFAIHRFDMELHRIAMQALFRKTDEVLDQIGKKDEDHTAKIVADLLKAVDDLLSQPTGKLLQAELLKLRGLLREQKWDAARELIAQLRHYTRERSSYEFAAILDNPETETWKGWIASFFIPALAPVRRQRRELRSPLYIESIYYLAQSWLLALDPIKMKEGVQRLKRMREARLSPYAVGRERDLNLLSACLEVETAVRVGELQPEEAGPYISLMPDQLKNQIKKAGDETSYRPDVRSAAHVAQGLMERARQKSQEAYLAKQFQLPDRDEQRRSWALEMEHYRSALDLKPSASTHCYLAECMLQMGWAEQALPHIRQALIMAPQHVLAKKLARQVTGR